MSDIPSTLGQLPRIPKRRSSQNLPSRPLRRAPRVGRLRLRGSEHTRDDYVLRVGLGCASALAQERHDILGKSLRDKDVRDVLLALEHYDPGVRQRGRHRLDVRFGWV
jgi:hypothetical protein